MKRSHLAVWLAPLVLLAAAPAQALVIAPTFDSSITSSANAAQVESAIDTAIGTIDGLYSNVITIPVTFTYDAAGSGNLESTSQEYYSTSYSNYVNLLRADATANPTNTVLATALANLSKGNDANGAKAMALTGGQLEMLTGSLTTPGDATININSSQAFSFSRPVSSDTYDAIGGLEHELDEVLGGGGGGSVLNEIGGTCTTAPSGFFCNKYGSLDLYRYSAASTPSFTTSGSATAYLSVDGGTTSVVGFNQNSGGDYGDFTPQCGPSVPGQLIQNAFNCTGQDEAYTGSSPEATMLQAIGWNLQQQAVPEPGSATLLASALAGIGLLGYRRANSRSISARERRSTVGRP